MVVEGQAGLRTPTVLQIIGSDYREQQKQADKDQAGRT